MKLAEVEVLGGIPSAHIFLVVTEKFIKSYIIKISEGKCNFNEKNNYASNFDEKHDLSWYEIIRRKEIDIYRKFKFLFFSFFHLSKMWYAKCKLLPSNQKTFFIETCTIQYKKD